MWPRWNESGVTFEGRLWDDALSCEEFINKELFLPKRRVFFTFTNYAST